MAGENIALISDAGTPGISDPGFMLVRECVSKPLYIFPVIFAVISITMMISISYNNGIVISSVDRKSVV